MDRTEGVVEIKERGTNLFGISAESKRVCIIADLGHETQEDIANADHIAVTWNASKGMTTKQAGLYLEHGEQALEILHKHCHLCGLGFDNIDEPRPCSANGGGSCGTKDIMTLMEGK